MELEAAHRDAELTALRSQIDRERGQLEDAHRELDRSRVEAGSLRGQIAAMESSKFWKLRQLWFAVKRAAWRTREE